MPGPLSEEELVQQIIQRYTHDFWGLEDIADHLAMDVRRIKRILKQNGIPLRTREESYLLRALKKHGNMDKLIDYVKMNMADPSATIKEVCQGALMQPTTLRNFCRRHGIEYKGARTQTRQHE